MFPSPICIFWISCFLSGQVEDTRPNERVENFQTIYLVYEARIKVEKSANSNASFTPNNFSIKLVPTVRSDWLQTVVEAMGVAPNFLQSDRTVESKLFGVNEA